MSSSSLSRLFCNFLNLMPVNEEKQSEHKDVIEEKRRRMLKIQIKGKRKIPRKMDIMSIYINFYKIP